MKVNVKKVTFDESKIEVETKSGVKLLVINRTPYGHSYEDFTHWDMTDNQYYELEELVDQVMQRMRGGSELNIAWD